MIFGPCQETSKNRHHVEPRVKLYSPREESFPIPLKYIYVSQNYTYELGCYARKPHRWLLEYRWIWRFVWFLDRFHSVYSIKWETSRWIHVVLEETDKTQGNIQARSFMARTLERNLKEPSAEGGSINGQLENRSSIMQRRLRGTYFIDPEDWNSRKSLRMQEENWKHQWLQPCLARHARRVSMGRPVARLMISSLNLRVSWKPVNPQECVWKNLYQNIMRTILQEEGVDSLQHYNLVHKYSPLPQAMKIPAAKAAVDKEWENLKRFRRGT